MHKIKYLHGSSYFKYEDVERTMMMEQRSGQPLWAPSQRLSPSPRLRWSTGSECENQEPVAPAPAPGNLASLCVCEKEPTVTVCVWAPRQDLTLRALAQLNKLTALPLPVSTELILQLGHIQKHILSSSKALQLSSKGRNPCFLYRLPATVHRRADNL